LSHASIARGALLALWLVGGLNVRHSHSEHSFDARRLAVLVTSLVLAVVVAGCGPIRLVSDYDDAIDRGATDYYRTMDGFLSAMARAAAKNEPAGRYAPNVKFYDDTGAALSTLIMRARAAEPKATCLGSDIVGTLTKQLLGLKPLAGAVEGLDLDEILKGLQSEDGGSCTARILVALRANHDLVAAIHQHNDRLAQAVVDIVRPTLEQDVRIVVTTEIAKKRGK
jgi:hypothetical protein